MKSSDKIILYGAIWCIDCRKSKKVLDENNIGYTYIDLDESIEAADEVIRINNGLQSIPTIVFPDGTVLVEPSNEELLTQLKKNNFL